MMWDGWREQTNKQVKVTIIETQYVKTDAANFKSVVHQFTGKDSKVAVAPAHASPMRPKARRPTVPILAQSQMEVGNIASGGSEASRALQNGMVDREAAFMEDLEPFLEDLYKLIN